MGLDDQCGGCMAVKAPARQYSKKLVFNLLIMVFLGWFVLFCWTMTLWMRFGFENAWQCLYRLSSQQRTALVQFNDASIAMRLPRHWVLGMTRNLSEMNHVIHAALPQSPFVINHGVSLITADAWRVTKEAWALMSMTGQIMLIKLTILLAAIPLFCLSMTAGLVDGLNQRAIRTASLGRESSYVFHQMNRYFKRGLVLLLGLWLALPVSIAPALMLVPVSVLLSVVVSVTASRFKKYV